MVRAPKEYSMLVVMEKASPCIVDHGDLAGAASLLGVIAAEGAWAARPAACRP